MSNKTRLAKLKLSKITHPRLSDEERERLKKSCEIIDAYRGEIPMTDDLQERISKIEPGKLEAIALTVVDDRSYLRGAMNLLY